MNEPYELSGSVAVAGGANNASYVSAWTCPGCGELKTTGCLCRCDQEAAERERVRAEQAPLLRMIRKLQRRVAALEAKP